MYTDDIFGEEDFDDGVCPWCIADGSAHARFDVTFVADDAVGDYGRGPAVPPEVVACITTRTPSFASWQTTRWLTCCADAAVFLGPIGAPEIEALGAEAGDLLVALAKDIAMDAGSDDFRAYVGTLDRDGSPTAFLFRCRHCGKLSGYSDSH